MDQPNIECFGLTTLDSWPTVQTFPVEAGDYTFLKKLGKGAFSRVYRGAHTTYDAIALKVFRTGSAYAKCARTEASILLQLSDSNPKSNIIKCFGICSINRHPAICLELGICDLYQHQKCVLDGEKPPDSMFPLTALAPHVLSALVVLESNRIVHRDLKPENILIVNRGGSLVAVVSDFGSAVRKPQSLTKDGYVMSAWYRSPEAYAKGLSCIAGDMWSFACILFEYAFGTPLFPVETSRRTLAQEHTALYRTHTHFLGEAPADYLHKSSPLPLHKIASYTLSVRDLKALNQASELMTRLPDVAELLHLILQWDPDARVTPIDALAIARTWDRLEPAPHAAHERPDY